MIVFPQPRRYVLCILAVLFMCGQAAASEPTWTLAMDDAELRELVPEMSAILETTIVLDPRVRGRITVLSEQPLDREGVRRLFYSVLDAHGFTIIDQGDRLLILPVTEAKAHALIDMPPLDEAQFVTRVISLSASAAADIAGLVRPLVSANGYVGPSPSANALVVTDTAAVVARVAAVIQRLDGGEHRAHSIVQVRNGMASELAPILEQTLAKTAGESLGLVIADAAGNRLIMLGSAPVRERLTKLAQALDTPASATLDNSRVIALRHGDAKQIAEVLEPVAQRLRTATPPSAVSKSASTESQASVKADEHQNALVIVGEPGHIRTLQSIVEKLDRPRAQVLIQAALVELTGEASEALGVQWGVSGSTLNGGIAFPGANLSVGALPGNAETKLPEGVALKIGFDHFSALVTALAKDANSNLLSTPSLLTLDHQQSEILVGQNVPFQTGSYTTSGSGADNPFTTVERKDVGISLKIRPHINEGDMLRLEVEQEDSSIAPSSLAPGDLVTNKRALKSTILAQDGEIIVIGGLIKDSVRSQVSGVPLLRSIPWLGGLFRWKEDVQTKTNLMVFLRPTIVRTAQDMKGLTQAREALLDHARGSRPAIDMRKAFGL